MSLKNIIIYSVIILLINSCSAANNPFTTNMEIPDGPPEYKAGWHDGCSSALSHGVFYNSRSKFDQTYGNGIYQHDPVYQSAFGSAYYVCRNESSDFIGFPMFTAPLEHTQ